MNWKNVLERCAWTFLEGFLVTISFTTEINKAMLYSGVMAGLSAMKTVIIEYARSRVGDSH